MNETKRAHIKYAKSGVKSPEKKHSTNYWENENKGETLSIEIEVKRERERGIRR